jgi:hypothetical protein
VLRQRSQLQAIRAAIIERNMDYLIDNCRPSLSLTKYIEIIGILNGLAYKNIRSKYKVLLPSNYYDTVCLLDQNADFVATFLAEINTADISNELAALIYSKTRENGFDDQKAFEDGGPELREIFSNVSQILTALEDRSSSSCCVPLGGNEILVAVTNDKASYAVLDSVSHILGDTILLRANRAFTVNLTSIPS